jgi:hypothetical protein
MYAAAVAVDSRLRGNDKRGSENAMSKEYELCSPTFYTKE